MNKQETNNLMKRLEENYKNKLRVSSISAVQREGTEELMKDIGKYLESIDG